MNIPITRSDQHPDDDVLLEPAAMTPSRVLRLVAYGSTALWAVSVVVGM